MHNSDSKRSSSSHHHHHQRNSNPYRWNRDHKQRSNSDRGISDTPAKEETLRRQHDYRPSSESSVMGPPQQLPSSRHRRPPNNNTETSLQGVDVFPSMRRDDLPRLKLDLPMSSDNIRTYINVLKGLRVYFHELDSKTWSANIDRHCDQSQQCNPIHYDKLDWAKVEQRLSIRPSEDRHNEDLRLLHRWDNCFLVKSFFTFGQRTPEPRTCHVLQTSAAPLLYYQLDEGRRMRDDYSGGRQQKRRYEQHEEHFSKMVRTKGSVRRMVKTVVDKSVDVKPKCFSSYDQFLYDRYVLQPFSIYRIDAGTNYLILTCQKSLFRVDVVPESLVESLESRGVYKFAYPTTDRKLLPNSPRGYCYDFPPATPIARPPPSPQRSSEECCNDGVFSSSAPSPPIEEQHLFDEFLRSLENEQQPPPQREQQQPPVVLYSIPELPTAPAAETSDPITWFIQQQQLPPRPETRDVGVNTEDSMAAPVRRVGLGIARKRLDVYMSPRSGKRMQQQQPLDLTTRDSREGTRLPTPAFVDLPPAPKKEIRDSGIYEPESSDDEEKEEEGSVIENEEPMSPPPPSSSDPETTVEEEILNDSSSSCIDPPVQQQFQELMDFDVPEMYFDTVFEPIPLSPIDLMTNDIEEPMNEESLEAVKTLVNLV